MGLFRRVQATFKAIKTIEGLNLIIITDPTVDPGTSKLLVNPADAPKVELAFNNIISESCAIVSSAKVCTRVWDFGHSLRYCDRLKTVDVKILMCKIIAQNDKQKSLLHELKALLCEIDEKMDKLQATEDQRLAHVKAGGKLTGGNGGGWGTKTS